MRPFVHRLQPLTGDVSVDLCGSHIGVSEQLLNRSQICSSFEEVRGVCVPQRVGVQRAAVGQRMAIEHPPHEMGADTESVLRELGYAASDIAGFRTTRVI